MTEDACNHLLEPGSVEISALAAAQAEIVSLKRQIEAMRDVIRQMQQDQERSHDSRISRLWS